MAVPEIGRRIHRLIGELSRNRPERADRPRRHARHMSSEPPRRHHAAPGALGDRDERVGLSPTRLRSRSRALSELWWNGSLR